VPSVNGYLLALSDGYCLVDCGTSMDPGWAALEHALELAGARPEEVNVLVCTHLHADHAGLAATVVERTGCELLRGLGPHTVDDTLRDPAVPLEARRQAGRREGIPEEELHLWVDAHLADDVHHERISPHRLLVAGDVLPARSGRWRVVPARGHSPTQIALFEDRRRWVISADLAYPIPEPFLEYGYTLDPYGEHLASLNRIAALEPARLLPGHGRPLADAPTRLREARRAAEALAPTVIGALHQGSKTAYDVVARLLTDPSEYNRRQSMLSIVLCVLEHLEDGNRVRAHVGDDGVRRFAAA